MGFWDWKTWKYSQASATHGRKMQSAALPTSRLSAPGIHSGKKFNSGDMPGDVDVFDVHFHVCLRLRLVRKRWERLKRVFIWERFWRWMIPSCTRDFQRSAATAVSFERGKVDHWKSIWDDLFSKPKTPQCKHTKTQKWSDIGYFRRHDWLHCIETVVFLLLNCCWITSNSHVDCAKTNIV